jgi:hypothetical protein
MNFAMIAAAMFALSGSAVAADAAPLFSSDEPIEIEIRGPIADIIKNAARSTEPLPATIVHDGREAAIELSARGNARRRPENCRFPPLRVKFTEKPENDTLFEGQKSLKLVTHCRAQLSFQKHTLLEFAAYKIYNVMTDASLKVRLARIRYVSEDASDIYAERLGFFIEDADDAAERIGMKEIKTPSVKISQHRGADAARVALFFHMIANHDWSMLAGPEDECCHNGKLFGADKTALSDLVFVPYDFDYSGFVNAPYAAPPDAIKIGTVKIRYYRGDCSLNSALPAAAQRIRDQRAMIEDAVRSTPLIDQKTANGAIKYLAPFFREIADDDAVAKLAERCR